MTELVQENWWLFIVALLIGIAVAWWVFAGGRRTRVETKSFDALDEDAPPARRNQALIDTPARPVAPQAQPPVPEPVKPEPPQLQPIVKPMPAPAPAPAQAEPPAAGSADDLTRIKGVGPKLQALLNSLGVTSFAQIAAWSEQDVERVDAQLGNFEGRIQRDNWIEQARLLAAGDIAAYESKFGNI